MSIVRELDRLENKGIRPGLSAVGAVARRLGDPQNRFPAILVGGTNGKGSTSACLEAPLRRAGYKTGLYTSPHLVDYTERMRINGRAVSPAGLEELYRRVKEAAKSLRQPLTQFEILTLMAFLHFARERVDIGICEVGLGGRWDATNLLGRVMATVITNVGLDHTDTLGNTLSDIAREKAGIVRPGIPIVTAARGAPLRIIKEKSAALGSPLLVLGRNFHPTPLCANWRKGTQRIAFSWAGGPRQRLTLGLLGKHQAENASLALAVLKVLEGAGTRIPEAALRAGFRRVLWPGRLEKLKARLNGGTVTFLLDGAHNPAGAASLASSLAESPWGKRPMTLLFGALRDKDIPGMIRWLSPRAGQVLTVPIDSARAARPEDLAHLWEKRAPRVQSFEALRAALSELGKLHRKESPVLVTGSLYLVGNLKKELRDRNGKGPGR